MVDVTILFSRPDLLLTPLQVNGVFRNAGTLWNSFVGTKPCPQFLVTTASVDETRSVLRRPNSHPANSLARGHSQNRPHLHPIDWSQHRRRGERNAPIVPWLLRWHKARRADCQCVLGRGLVAAAGLLDGKRATTHWSLAEHLP